MADKPLELEPRKKTYNAIDENPGVHLRELDRLIDVPLGTIRYHLRVLEKRGLIVARKEGKYKRYYVKGTVDKTDKDKLAVLRKELPRTIILFLLEYPGSTHGDIAEVMDVAPSTISYHLGKLSDGNIVEKVDGRYVVKEEEKVADLLIQYQQTFLDSLVDRFVRLWTKE
ncbi:MAG: helix-turn-helix domain-containing protein [Thermoplasmata archaeon]